MTASLAFTAAALAVAGVWELLAAIETAALTRAVAPLVRAGREGVSPTAAEQRRLAILAAAVLAAGGWFVAGPLAGALAGVAGPAVAMSALRARRRRFRAALAADAPVVARAFADALAAGHAVRGALEQAASLPGPAGHELRRAAAALAYGKPTEAVLERLRERAASPAWDAMIAGILLQRDAGGDLPALLRDLAAALESAARQEREAQAATAQARFTARVVLVLPLGAALLAELAQPGLLGGLMANPISAWLTILALLLQVIALACVRRLTR